MRIGVIGTGYVGLVVGACLAESGNDVVCGDVDVAKVEALSRGEVPIYEPGLDPLIERNLSAGRLRFTADIRDVVRTSDVLFISVGTPPDEDGSADLTHVLDVASVIGEEMNGEKIVITKSTVPVGTAQKVRKAIESRTSHPVHICSNPEFLKEGAAVDDFMKPDRVVIGTDSDYARGVLDELYAPFVRTGNPVLFMDIASAEITKYAANAMLATRISFMNLIAGLCAEAGASVDHVRAGVGSDSRIGSAFLFAGVGYGGSCFPKDVKALIGTLRATGQDAKLLEAVEEVNERQKRLPLRVLDAHLGADLASRTIGVWGLSFKAGTDDMREAASLVVVEGLLERGATVRVHDPQAMGVAQRHFGERVSYCGSNYDCAAGADALVILTEWQPYRHPDFARIRREMRGKLIIDGRNLFRPERMTALGFAYESVGRASGTTA